VTPSPGPSAQRPAHRRPRRTALAAIAGARRRRRVVYALSAAALLVSAAVGAEALADAPAPIGTAALADAPAAASTPPSTTAQEKGMTSGAPLRDPADAVTGKNLTITLDAATTRFDLSGRQVSGESYNGQFVAPTLHLTPGSTVTIQLVNHLAVATNLHFHGLHVSPADHSDDDFLCVAPGHTLTYRLAIPANHPLGTFWYHSHAMGTTCPDPASQSTAGMPGMAGMSGMPVSPSPTASGFTPADVENQIFAGLSGALVVGDDRTLLPASLRHVTAHTLVLKDVQIDSGGHIVQNTDTTSINSDNPTVRLVNGQLQPVLSMHPGETQLWRLVNAGADIFYQLHLDGYQFAVIGEDGTPAAKVTNADTLLLPPGKRYDVLVTAPGTPGKAWLHTLAYSNGPQGDSYPDVDLARLDVTGAPVHRLPTVGAMPTAPADLASAPIAQHRTVSLSESADGNSFYLNGQQFSMTSSIFATPARLGTVEEWTLVNTSGEDHPFHLHTTSFEVMSINGVAQPYTRRLDVVPVPHAVNGVPGKVVIRIPFADYPGTWMFHCHIAAHEDNGMMSYINVIP
jgi:FtsP/CotA-like multicopper oxidase with cupredoxin domain